MSEAKWLGRGGPPVLAAVAAALAGACSVDGEPYRLGEGGSPSSSGRASAIPSSGGQQSSASGGRREDGSGPATSGAAQGGESGAKSNHGGGSGTESHAGNGGAVDAEGGAPTAGAPASTGGSGGAPTGAGGATGGRSDGCERELLENGNFDAGRTVWSETWDGGEPFQIIVPRDHARLSAAGVTPRDGDYLAWLGGIPDDEWDSHNTVLSQPIEIPADAAFLTLTGYIWIRSLESPETKADYAVIELEDAEGNIPWQIKLWNRDHATSGWVYFEQRSSELDALRGRRLTFVAQARTDLTEETSFWLDSLSFVSRCR